MAKSIDVIVEGSLVNIKTRGTGCSCDAFVCSHSIPAQSFKVEYVGDLSPADLAGRGLDMKTSYVVNNHYQFNCRREFIVPGVSPPSGKAKAHKRYMSKSKRYY